MIDCALDQSLPSIHKQTVKIPKLHAYSKSSNAGGISSLDAVLISNHHNILAIPFLTEYYGFKGQIFATEPTIQLGKLLLEELHGFLSSKSSSGQLPSTHPSVSTAAASFDVHQPHSQWPRVFAHADIEQALQRIEQVSFGQQINLYNLVSM